MNKTSLSTPLIQVYNNHMNLFPKTVANFKTSMKSEIFLRNGKSNEEFDYNQIKQNARRCFYPL